MTKWIVLLLIAGGIYYVSQNWSSLTSQWNAQIEHFLTGAPSPNGALPTNAGQAANSGTMALGVLPAAPVADSWGARAVGGLMIDLPFSLQRYTPTQPTAVPANIHVEVFGAESNHRIVCLAHASNSNAGLLALSGSEKALGAMAEKLKMDVISHNTATTLINGLRARRSDYIAQSGNPRLRDRCVLLERANQAWLIEYVAPENDAEAEKAFLRIAQSAR